MFRIRILLNVVEEFCIKQGLFSFTQLAQNCSGGIRPRQLFKRHIIPEVHPQNRADSFAALAGVLPLRRHVFERSVFVDFQQPAQAEAVQLHHQDVQVHLPRPHLRLSHLLVSFNVYFDCFVWS